MRILVTADLHFNRQQFAWLAGPASACDLVVVAGDVLDLAGHLPIPEQIAAVRPTLEALRKVTRVVVASGNHDADAATTGGEAYARWIAELASLGILADGAGLDLADTRLTICPWWNGPVVREQLVTQLAAEQTRADGKRWWWIHHAPPRGSRIAWTRRGNAGDPFLLRLIGQYRPEGVICGHIHDAPFHPNGGWAERLDATWVFNPGKQPGAEPTHIVLDLAARTATYTSCEHRETLPLDPAPAG